MTNATTLANGVSAYTLKTSGTKTYYVRADALTAAELTYLDAAAGVASGGSIPLATYLSYQTYAPSVTPTGVISPAAVGTNALTHFQQYQLIYDTADAYNALRLYGVESITITAGGTGYTSAPTVGFSGGGGSNAAGTAVIDYEKVTAIAVTAGGSGYTSTPTVTFTGGVGTGAAATAIVANGAVVAIVVTNQGSGYTGVPTIGFTGGGGTGATAVATVGAGAVVSVTMSNHGSGYYAAPTVAFTGGAGSNAAGTANLTLATEHTTGDDLTALVNALAKDAVLSSRQTKYRH